MKFDYALKNHQMGEISKLVLKSNQMLEATLKKRHQNNGKAHSRST